MAINKATEKLLAEAGKLGLQQLDLPGMGALLLRITPDVAMKWLGKNRNNRPISHRIIAQYARDIATGGWAINGDTICFDDAGNLRNGQHRLGAITIAKVPMDTWVVFGVPEGAFDTYDLGHKRSPAQVLQLRGERYGTQIAAATALMWRYEQGRGAMVGSQESPTVHDRLGILHKYPDLRTSTEYVIGSLSKLAHWAGSSAVSILVHAHGSRTQGIDLTNAFFDALNSGENITASNPIYALRETLRRNKEIQVRMRQHEVFGMWQQAWNAYVDRRTIRRLYPLDWTQSDLDYSLR